MMGLTIYIFLVHILLVFDIFVDLFYNLNRIFYILAQIIDIVLQNVYLVKVFRKIFMFILVFTYFFQY